MANLEGRAALVTGGSRGIGRAIATALADHGASVAVAGRDRAALDRIVAELPVGLPARAVALAGDLREPEACERIVREAVASLGRLDVLINNAGVGVFEPVESMSGEAWRTVIGTNLDAVFYCCRAAIPELRRSGDAWIVNIGSLAGRNTFVGGAAYCASKHGLLGFSDSLMLEVRDQGIRVACVMPGSVATEFSHPQGAGGEDWRLHADDVAQVVLDLIRFPSRALPSRVEIRPTRPPSR